MAKGKSPVVEPKTKRASRRAQKAEPKIPDGFLTLRDAIAEVGSKVVPAWRDDMRDPQLLASCRTARNVWVEVVEWLEHKISSGRLSFWVLSENGEPEILKTTGARDVVALILTGRLTSKTRFATDKKNREPPLLRLATYRKSDEPLLLLEEGPLRAAISSFSSKSKKELVPLWDLADEMSAINGKSRNENWLSIMGAFWRGEFAHDGLTIWQSEGLKQGGEKYPGQTRENLAQVAWGEDRYAKLGPSEACRQLLDWTLGDYDHVSQHFKHYFVFEEEKRGLCVSRDEFETWQKQLPATVQRAPVRIPRGKKSASVQQLIERVFGPIRPTMSAELLARRIWPEFNKWSDLTMPATEEALVRLLRRIGY